MTIVDYHSEELCNGTSSPPNGSSSAFICSRPPCGEQSLSLPTSVTVLKGLFMASTMGAAIIGNLLVIVSILRYERLRLVANAFIASLAFADLLVACLVMPFGATKELAVVWPYGQVVCDIFNANDVLFSTASLLHLCCISMDRYVAITDPLRYDDRLTAGRVAAMLTGVWVASAVISHLPIHLGWYTTEAQWELMATTGDYHCSFEVNRVYGVISSAVSFWTPAIIMVFTYRKIFQEAVKQEKCIESMNALSSREPSTDRLQYSGVDDSSRCRTSSDPYLTIPGNPSRNFERPRSPDRNHLDRNNLNRNLCQQHRKKMRREHKAAKTLGVIMGAFLFCWMPFFVWYLTVALCGPRCPATPGAVETTLFWVGYLNSALNPVIYALLNRDFRDAFRRLLRCGRHRNDTQNECRTTVTVSLEDISLR